MGKLICYNRAMLKLKVVFSLCCGLLPIQALAQSPQLKSFAGIYRGVSYTSEVRGGVGEIEVRIDGEYVVTRLATGREVRETKRPLSAFTPVDPKDHVTNAYPNGHFLAFAANGGFPHYYFMLEPVTDGELALFVVNSETTDESNLTALFSSDKDHATSCAYFLDELDRVLEGTLARLPDQP